MSNFNIDQQTKLDIKEIIKILPHRYPFLLVDKIIDYDLEKGFIVGQKNVTINEAFFTGHFPEAPIMPGVLIIESLAQTGAVFIFLKGYREKTAVLLNLNNAKFRHPVKPGDILRLRCEGLHLSTKGGRFKAQAYTSEDKLAAEAEIGFVLVEKEQI
jgi:3-hydroxyacyl-[acyl-carrier-protein] dehydratase